jgi:hypothetical protein
VQSLELVRNDLVQLVEQARELEDHNRRVLEAVSLVWSATDSPGLVEKDPATFDALAVMLGRRTVRFPKAAYEELVATGNLRALADPGLRTALVRFYEELGRDEEIVLRNNEAFTDVLLNGLLIGEGLMINLPGGRTEFAVGMRGAAEDLRAQYLPAGPTFAGRLWGLPSGHPDRVRLLSATTSIGSAASTHLILARAAGEGAAALIVRIDATLD